MSEFKITTKKVGDKYHIVTDNIKLQDNETKKEIGIRSTIDIYNADAYEQVLSRVEEQLTGTNNKIIVLNDKLSKLNTEIPKRTHDKLAKASLELDKVLKYREYLKLKEERNNYVLSKEHLEKEKANLKPIEE